MTIFAAVMTGQGTGAISTIQVFGNSAEIVLRKIFKPAGTKPLILATGKILLGTITDSSETIDQVTIGCEAPDTFAINCHGNPLIVADIMQLLEKNGVKLLTTEQLFRKMLLAGKSLNTIAVEAKLAQPGAKTIEGAKIIANQTGNGLNRKAKQWLRDITLIGLDEIKGEAEQILQKSQTAKLIIAGCKAAIVGPPNAGKSTLLNFLAGRQKAIVTNIKGTTRDWVSAECRIGPMSVELIDTAGLDEKLTTTANAIEKESQEKSIQLSEQADLVLLVLDNSQTAEQLDEKLLKKIVDKKVLTVLNKSDLPNGLNTAKLPQVLANTVRISAKFGTGIENLLKKIQQICGVVDFDLHTTVCFTDRQENLLKQLKNTKSAKQATLITTELLNSQLNV